MLQEKQLLKDSPKHFLVAGMDKYFPTSFWWSLSILLPYWEEIYSLNWGPSGYYLGTHYTLFNKEGLKAMGGQN